MFVSQYRRTAIAIALCSTILAAGAAPPQTPAQVAAQLTSIVAAALPQAPLNFAAWRAGHGAANTSGVNFKPTAALTRLCGDCYVADEYATADTDEKYALTFDWIVPKSWSRAKTIAYIQQTVGESLSSGYTATQGTHTDGEAWFDWWKSSNKSFVYVETMSGKTQNGFEVRVGHYLKSNLHYVPYAKLSASQRTDLGNAVRNLVQLGVQNGADNFTSLRGKMVDKDFYDTNMSFGEYLSNCDVSGIFFASASEGTSKWVLSCSTPSLGGAKSDVEEVIRAAAAQALPEGFTSTTDPKYLFLNDYRWDRSTDVLSVDVMSSDNNDGTLEYTVSIYHYLT
jgi:hypothetical protein